MTGLERGRQPQFYGLSAFSKSFFSCSACLRWAPAKLGLGLSAWRAYRMDTTAPALRAGRTARESMVEETAKVTVK